MTATQKEQLHADTIVRKWVVDVNVNSYDTPVWKPLNAIYNCKPIQAPTVKDSSDFDSDFGSDGIVLIKWGVEVKVWRKRRVSAPTEYDEAQEFLRALGGKVLGANIADIRYYEMVEDGPQEEAYRGYVAVGWVPDGGATEDYDSITITLYGKSDREEITHPDSVASVPTVASITPATGGTAGGEAVWIFGQHFTNATAVKFDTDPAADFEVIDDYHIAVVTPALAADTYTVFVTNPTGTNATGPTYITS